MLNEIKNVKGLHFKIDVRQMFSRASEKRFYY